VQDLPRDLKKMLLFSISCWSFILMVVADYSTSVRIFEALREKTENKTQYDAYVNELKPVREELGMFWKSFDFLQF
jgi:Cytochrome c oxidase subunit Va